MKKIFIPAKLFAVAAVALMASYSNCHAVDFVLDDGDWDNPAAWSGGVVPGGSDPVSINDGLTANITTTIATRLVETVIGNNAGGTCSLIVQNNGIFVQNEGSFGNLRVGGTTAGTSAGIFTVLSGGKLSSINGDLEIGNVAAGTAGTATFASGSTIDLRNGVINVNAGTLRFEDGVTIAPYFAKQDFSVGAAGTLEFQTVGSSVTSLNRGNSAISSLTLDAGSTLSMELTGAHSVGDSWTIMRNLELPYSTTFGTITDPTVGHENYVFTADYGTAVAGELTVTLSDITTGIIEEFYADPTHVASNGTVTLSWVAPLADSLSISGIGDVTGLTSTQAVVSADTIYTLTAIQGTTTNYSLVEVTMVTTAPDILSFEASSTNVFPGSAVTLFWDVDNATGLSIDHGIGDVTGLTSTQVVFTADITYTLTATNVLGLVVDSVTLNANTNTNPSGICLNFNPGGSGAVSGSEVVGVNGVSADLWVNLGGSATAVDIDGVGGSATIDFHSDYNFEATSTNEPSYLDGSQNSLMMKRAIRVDGPGDETITISGLGAEYTAAGYDVYVYYGTDNHERTHRFSVGGIAVAGLEQLVASWQGSFLETVNDTETGNYAVASGLTASSFTIVDNGTAPGKGGITGIEIILNYVPVPVFLSSDVISGGTEMEISWPSDVGASYTVETNSNLIIGNWQPFMPGIDGIDGEIAVTNTIGPDQTFYRVITE